MNLDLWAAKGCRKMPAIQPWPWTAHNLRGVVVGGFFETGGWGFGA